MTKIIERPDSTTHILEFPFHLIKDEKEAENVRKLSEGKQIIQMGVKFSSTDFRVMTYFAIVEPDKPFVEWPKYAQFLELGEGTQTRMKTLDETYS